MIAKCFSVRSLDVLEPVHDIIEELIEQLFEKIIYMTY